MMDSPHIDKKETGRDTTIDAVQYEIFREITPIASAKFDADQNISDFKENNNSKHMVYALIGRLSQPSAKALATLRDEKKGCAARTPNPNREPSGNGAKPSPKTRLQYGYLSPVAP
jgi:hypothetical protein